MIRIFSVGLMLALAVGMNTNIANAQFSDNFDSYANGQLLDGVGGWQGWWMNAAVAGRASNAFSNSSPNSIIIKNNNDDGTGPSTDAVNRLNGPYASGQWSITCEQYIPSGGLGNQFFILLNNYNDVGDPGMAWSTQIRANLATGIVDDANPNNSNTTALVYDQWVPIRVDIDLDADTCDEYYNGVLQYSGAWSERGLNDADRVSEIDAIDLYGGDDAGGVVGNAYYDDLVVAQIPSGGCVPPDSYNVYRGIQRSGDLGSFADADGNVATFNPGFTINNQEAPVWLEFTANNPNATDVSVTSTAGTPGIGIRAECLNWTTGMYVQVGAQEDETFNVQTKHTFGPIDAACIDGSGNVKWRIGWRKKGFTINFPWLISVDATGACN